VTPEQELVERLAFKSGRADVMRALLGSANAIELRSAEVTDAAFEALTGGLGHQNPQVRWWSIKLLDHCADGRATDAIVPLLDDPVPRVRRNAVHALSCATCKPKWSGELPRSAVERIAMMAGSDPNDKVRGDAVIALVYHHQETAVRSASSVA
jgi:HEAT repeat protein